MASVPITEMPEGMVPWVYMPPPCLAEFVEVWRQGWTDTAVISRHCDPAMNIAGLYWRQPRPKDPPVTHAIN